MAKIRPICAELKQVAETELNEKEENIEKELAEIRHWIAHQPHLRARTNNDQFLITIIRGSKHRMDKVKEKIDAFYTVRTASPELFQGRDVKIDRIREILRLGIGLPMPNTDTKSSPRVLLIRAGAYDANKYSFAEIIKIGMMISDIQYLEDDNMAISGDMGIFDIGNVTGAHFLQLSPGVLKKMVMMKQEGSPLRQRGFHFINTPMGFEMVANMGKKLLSEKNRKKFLVHSKMETLYEYIPQRLLPKEYGGEAGTIAEIVDYWEKKFWEHRDYLLEELTYGTDESKRPNPTLISESMFGVQGTFKQLEID